MYEQKVEVKVKVESMGKLAREGEYPRPKSGEASSVGRAGVCAGGSLMGEVGWW
jgi:hypothetical protein